MIRGALCFFSALLVGVIASASPGAAANSVGVAPFEKAGAGQPPEVATLLADRLLTAGVETVGPDRMGVPAVAEPESRQVMSWAEDSGVDVLVFGRVTGIGSRYSVDVQVRSARTGEVMSVHVAEISRPGAVGEAVDELARKVMEGLDAAPSAGPRAGRPVAASPPAEPAAASSASIPSPLAQADSASAVASEPAPAREGRASAQAPSPSGGTSASPRAAASRPASSAADDGDGLFGGGAPVRITSDTLEARQSGGARHMIFQNSVRATRDDLVLTSDRLDAFYPKGSSRPEKLVATGRVVMKRDDGEAHCSKMTYIDAQQMIHCEGNAELTRDGDVATGDKIEWDLETDTVFIKGNADVLLTDSGDDGGS